MSATVVTATDLVNYSICARRAAVRIVWPDLYTMGIRFPRLPRGIAALRGTATHYTVAHGYTEQARTGTLPPLSMLLDVARDHLTEAFRDGDIAFDGPRGITHNQSQALRQVHSAVTANQQTIAPTVEPIIVEERREAEIEPGLILSGQPDLVCREPKAIRDLKTGVRQPASFAPQLGAYSLLCRSTGIDVEQTNIDFIRSVAVNRPQPNPVTITAQVGQAETAAASIIKHIAGDIRTFREGDPARRINPGDPWAFMANPSCTLCSAKYCRAFGTDWCHEGSASK